MLAVRVLLIILLFVVHASAADRVSRATNNFTTAATWGTVDAASKLVSTSTGSTTLTTGNLDSATFTPGAVILDRLCVRLITRATGSPTNTITITLRNSTTATNAQSVTANVSDLAVSDSTERQGGWYCFKFSATHTPNGTDLYVVRATLSSTSTAVALATNGTANNFQHLLVSTTTGAPGAGDDLYIAGELDGSTNPATPASFTVTMDSTAATDYGSAQTSLETPGLSISKFGTLSYGTTAATNYVLRLSGWLIVYSAGTLNIGTTGTPMPRDSTAVLEFDCAADGDFKLYNYTGSTRSLQGQSRTSGKNVFYTLLTANLAGGGGSATVADDTGWLAGDEVGIASTTRTASQSEVLTLTSNAGASSLSFTGTAVNAHGGSATDKIQAEVVLLTRNVILRSVSTTAMSGVIQRGSAAIDDDWVMFRYMGYGNAESTPAYAWWTTSGSVTLDYGLIRDAEGSGLAPIATTGAGSILVNSTAIYNSCSAAVSNCAGIIWGQNGAALTALTFNDMVIVGDAGTGNGMYITTPGNIPSNTDWTTWRVAGYSSTGLSIAYLIDYLGVDLGPFVTHSNGSGITISSGYNFNFGNITAWRNNGNGIIFSTGALVLNLNMGTVLAFGNTPENVLVQSGCSISGWHINELNAYGDTSFSSSKGLSLEPTGTFGFVDLIVDKADFGTSNGSAYTTHTTDVISAKALVRVSLNNTLLASATEVNLSATTVQKSYVSLQRYDRIDDNHKTMTPEGTVSYETGTVYTTGPSTKLTPLSATRKINTAANIPGRGIYAGVTDGNTKTISVQVRKDGSYNGNAPRVIIKANSSVGYDVDTVCDTLTVGANTWEELTCTTSAATDDGVFEFVVDADGTAGAVYVDAWAIK